MASPDMTKYVDLRLYDKTPSDIYNAALTTLQANLPTWNPEQTNIEVMLLQAMSVEVAEAAYTINRLPNAMTEVMLGLFGVIRLTGTNPTVTLQFTVTDTSGYTIPAGTQVAMTWPGHTYSYPFFTDVDLVITPSNLTGTGAATGSQATASLNGTLSGTSVELMDSIVAVDSVVTTTNVSGGVDPETDADFYTRGVQVLQRMSQTLVIPEHFTYAALEQTTLVSRATTIDNYDPGTGPNPGDNPGNITVAVYGLGTTLTAPEKATLEASLSDRASAQLVIHVVDPNMETQNVTCAVKKYPQYSDTEVTDQITAALTDFMSPETWPWSGTLRLNELITVISNCAYVDYVVSMTTPNADVAYGINNTLVTLGTVTLTIT
jgi:uncharacterized phage protein gp47/JayE